MSEGLVAEKRCTQCGGKRDNIKQSWCNQCKSLEARKRTYSKCTKCGSEKNENRANWCPKCCAEWKAQTGWKADPEKEKIRYLKRKQKMDSDAEFGRTQREMTNKSAKRRRDAVNSAIVTYLFSHPCVDCGETDIDVLEFDHVRGKRWAVSTRKTASIAMIMEELDKCDVRCANCHRRVTRMRAGYSRYQYVNSPAEMESEMVM